MKIAGVATFSGLEVFEFTVPKGADGKPSTMSVRVGAPPLGFRAEMIHRLPDPRAPVRTLRDENGHVRRYETGLKEAGRPVVAPDVQDPDYQADVVRIEALRIVAIAYEGTREGGDIEWGATPPERGAPAKDWRRFYEALLEELTEARFPMMSLARISKRIMQLAGIGGAEVDELADRFSGEGSPES